MSDVLIFPRYIGFNPTVRPQGCCDHEIHDFPMKPNLDRNSHVLSKIKLIKPKY